MTRKKSTTTGFEASLAALEQLVEKMEQGDLSLEDALQHFEQGVKLSRGCQQALKEAEQKVSVLMQKNGQDQLEPFDSEDT